MEGQRKGRSNFLPSRPGTIFSLEEPLHPVFDVNFRGDGQLDTPEEHGEAWRPLISLLEKFYHLTDLVYECEGRFAPGLIGAIQQYHPTCKIHLHRFRFKSLHDDTTDPDELALATSPCLHSLSILGTYRDPNGVDDHNNAAALRTVSLAPKLKHVRMLGCLPASTPELYLSRNRRVEAWKGFKPSPEPCKKALLESLSFCRIYDKLSRSKLDEWAQVTDLTVLRRFSFAIIDASVLPELMVYSRLSHLEELSILLQREQTDEQFESIVETFFRDLNPLTALKLSGTISEELLHTVCLRHGPALERLMFRPYEDHFDMAGPALQVQSAHIRVIALSCPHLSDLNIRIKRSRGDAMETACYEAIGCIRTLKTAQIYLDCANPSNDRPEGTILEIALVNSAVDETLATSIWDTICHGSHGQRLECLTIESGGGSSFGNSHPGDLMTLVGHLSRGYQITKTNTGEGDGIAVVELTKDYREENDRRECVQERAMLEKWGHKDFTWPAYKAFNQLWPFEESGKDWRTVWRSWPLQRSK